MFVQSQPLLHQGSSSPKGKAPAPAENGNEASCSSGAQGESSSKAESWPAVVAAEVNEPVGIITIEDVLEELIGQVCNFTLDIFGYVSEFGPVSGSYLSSSVTAMKHTLPPL